MDHRVEFLQIEPTTRCNFTCGFCCGRHMPQADVDVETFLRALEAFPDLRHIELQGEGEPLMHPRFFEMVTAARERGIRVSLITNGSYFSAPVVDRLLEGGIETIAVSIESANPRHFREIRGGKLEKVVAGIERLMALRSARRLDRPAVGFAVTLLEKTKAGLPAIMDLYERLGMDGGVRLQMLAQMEPYVRHYDDQLKGQRPANMLGVLSAEETERAAQIQRRRRPLLSFYEALFAGWTPGSMTCPWLERALYVAYDGTATGCCAIKDGGRFGFGRIGVDPPAEILARRRALAAALREGPIPEPCRGCGVASGIHSRRARVHLPLLPG